MEKKFQRRITNLKVIANYVSGQTLLEDINSKLSTAPLSFFLIFEIFLLNAVVQVLRQDVFLQLNQLSITFHSL